MGIFDTSFYIFHLALYTHSYWFCINKIKFVKQNTFCLLSYSIEYFRHKKKLSRCSFFSISQTYFRSTPCWYILLRLFSELL